MYFPEWGSDSPTTPLPMGLMHLWIPKNFISGNYTLFPKPSHTLTKSFSLQTFKRPIKLKLHIVLKNTFDREIRFLGFM